MNVVFGLDIGINIRNRELIRRVELESDFDALYFNKYYMIVILSIVLTVVLFIFNFYQTKIGGVIFALSIGASI
ncbi:hypothetical protein CN581_29570 [Bacillus toyonensis]|uniref:hypothetical protein n=1 Tax=Bacillus toyonensis TaxID=155322 RepID=UPI000BF46D91|nr:hypothetical protein [Bacillus toyonensis]PEP73615.1 hypothetical protein CN581_29570 [Bacillus toyonensis]